MVKSFRGYVPIEPPAFDLESPDGARVEHIRCVPMLPGRRFLDFLSKADNANPREMATAIDELFRHAIVGEEWSKFDVFTNLPENGVGMDQLAEIAGYLGEVYSKRPTTPSAPSSAG